MKVFLSWSGDLSKNIAECLSKWLGCLLQTVEVFYSPDDIEKGENWDQRISAELNTCNYGIICLTSDNVSAPWVNFEAGAIAKAFDSRVATLMININPSDIKGPLKRYQSTKLEKTDFFLLVQAINRACDSKIDDDRLSTTYEGLWSSIETELNKIIQSYKPQKAAPKKLTESVTTEAIEEILQLIRKQTTILSSPEQLIPREYLEAVLEGNQHVSIETVGNLLSYLEYLSERLSDYNYDTISLVLKNLDLLGFVQSLGKNIPRKNRIIYDHYVSVRRRFERLNSALQKNNSDEELPF